MVIVPFPPSPTEGKLVAAAVDLYLDSVQTTTRDSYAETLAWLTALVGDRAAAVLAPEDYAAVMERWADAATATWNRTCPRSSPSRPGRSARRSSPPTPPGVQRCKSARRGDRSIPRARLDKLSTNDRAPCARATAVANAV
ncbi:hypothetical protein ACFYOK_37040 [Microbispora bryophytorum]|uniref:hypothetical protein n=1 Tax=Microbispora bryophytorum TaxID=1460882 RepID=UPI0033C26611